jgi:ankyrin repeat protein
MKSLLLLCVMSTALINHHMLWGMEPHKKPPPSDEFWCALNNDDTATVKRLYKEFDLNVEDDTFGMTPLMLATYNGNVELVKLFLQGGAEVNARNSKTGRTALMYVTGPGGRRDCNEALVKIFLAKGAERTFCAFNGYTPMKMAVGDDSRLVPLLIEAGADSSSKDGALYLAIGVDNLKTLALLADNTDYSHGTLFYAKNHGEKGDKKVLTIAAQKNVARKVLQDAQRGGIGAVDAQGIIKKQFGAN